MMTVTDGDRMMEPRITLNGMTREQHVRERIDILNAIEETMQKLGEIRPHGRDYIGDEDARQRDLTIHNERFAVLDKLRNEIQDEALAIQEGGA